ncbi:unnamed protein product [Closterium sp. Naga37s-1]|nr:unnamed protein product [Closterium sp. Naga37s-1]
MPTGRGRPGGMSPSGRGAAAGGRGFARSASQPVRKLDAVRHPPPHTPPNLSPLSGGSSAHGAAAPPGLPPVRRPSEPGQAQARARPVTAGKVLPVQPGPPTTSADCSEGGIGGGRGAMGAQVRISAAAAAAAAAAGGGSSATAALPPGGGGGLRTVAGAVASRALRKSASAPQVRPGEGASTASARAVAERAALRLKGRGADAGAGYSGGGVSGAGSGGVEAAGAAGAGIGGGGADRPRTRVGRLQSHGGPGVAEQEDSPRQWVAHAPDAQGTGAGASGLGAGGFTAPLDRPSTPPRRDMSGGGGGGTGGGVGVAAVGVGVVVGRPRTPARMDLHEAERVRLAAAAGGEGEGGAAVGGAVQAPVTPRVVERPSTPLAGQRPASPLLRAEGALERPKTPTRRQEAEDGALHGRGAAAWPEGAAEGQGRSGTPRLRAEGGGQRPTTPTRRGEAAVGARGEGRVGRAVERPTTPLHGAEGGPPSAFTTRATERLDVEAERLNAEGERLDVEAERLGAAARVEAAARPHTAVPRGVGAAAQGQAGSRADRADRLSFRGKVRPKSFVERRGSGDGGGGGGGVGGAAGAAGAWGGVGAVPRPTTPVRRGDGSMERAVTPGGRVGERGGGGGMGGGGGAFTDESVAFERPLTPVGRIAGVDPTVITDRPSTPVGGRPTTPVGARPTTPSGGRPTTPGGGRLDAAVNPLARANRMAPFPMPLFPHSASVGCAGVGEFDRLCVDHGEEEDEEGEGEGGDGGYGDGGRRGAGDGEARWKSVSGAGAEGSSGSKFPGNGRGGAEGAGVRAVQSSSSGEGQGRAQGRGRGGGHGRSGSMGRALGEQQQGNRGEGRGGAGRQAVAKSPSGEAAWAAGRADSAPADADVFRAFILGRPYADVEERFEMGGEVLARGEFGAVRVCVERESGARLACKTIDKQSIQSADEARNLRREVAAMEVVSGHPNVVQLHAACEDDKSIFLVMELCRGGDLFDFMRQYGRLPESMAAPVCRQLLAALHHCHTCGVLHRDVKPENVLLLQPGSVKQIKLVDFGISTDVEPDAASCKLYGTPLYLAPETLDGIWGPPADVWSTGVLVYALLSGLPPFWAASNEAIYNAIRTKAPRFSSARWKHVSEEAKELLQAMLVKDPTRRITTSQALGDASFPIRDALYYPFSPSFPPFST